MTTDVRLFFFSFFIFIFHFFHSFFSFFFIFGHVQNQGTYRKKYFKKKEYAELDVGAFFFFFNQARSANDVLNTFIPPTFY